MFSDPAPTSGDLELPVLQWSGLRPGVAVVRTWYESFAGLITPLLPHDLLAAWLLPEHGAPVLLGPLALADDRITLPDAAPLVDQEGLYDLEDRVRAAGFRSVMAVPVRAGARDAGILVAGAFAADRYDRDDLRVAHRIAAQLGGAFGRLAAGRWLPPVPRPTDGTAAPTGAILEALLAAVEASRRPDDLLALASDVLASLLPHDRIEVVTAREAPRGWALFSATEGDRLADPGVVATRRIEALVHHLGGGAAVRVDDLAALGLAWPTGGGRVRGTDGGALAVRLEVAGRWEGWLLVGSDAPGWFRDEDLAVAALAGRMLAPAVAALRR